MKDSLTDKVEEAFDLYLDENLDWVKTEWGLWEDKDVDIAWILKSLIVWSCLTCIMSLKTVLVRSMRG